MSAVLPTVCLTLLLGLVRAQEDLVRAQQEFRVANMFSSRMVLQREPHSPSVWGLAPPNTRVGVNISLGSESLQLADHVPVGEDGVWTVSLGKWPPGIGYSLHFMLEDTGDLITLEDISFGDVWVCSGQSNMVLLVRELKEEENCLYIGNWCQFTRIVASPTMLKF